MKTTKKGSGRARHRSCAASSLGEVGLEHETGSELRGRRRALLWMAPLTATLLAGCAGAPEGGAEASELTPDGNVTLSTSAAGEDGLAEAFSTFLTDFANMNFDAQLRMGVSYHPGLSTERVAGPDGALVNGTVSMDMNSGLLVAELRNVSTADKFDLWLVKNEPGGTVAPEAGEPMLKVGRFQLREGFQSIEVALGTDIAFDLDLVVVTRAGKKPHQSRVAVGNRTLFEKRLFRFRRGEGLDPVTGELADDIETRDPLVARGAHLFFNETFGGNGRTCGTCHRAENNLTIDPAFIATLPQSDPLFVAENNPALAQLENPELLRSRGLILENVDGFEDPTQKFVMRSVNHTLSLGLTNGIGAGFGAPPDHRLGWGGDGGPGRNTLHEFTFGAVMQHFTNTLERRPGVDFRIPTQEELDALEAFQLFTGRQKPFDFNALLPTDPRAQSGSSLFNNTGCTFCHNDISSFTSPFSGNFDTGVANLTPDLPDDDGFGSPGNRSFDPPPLVEAADTPPFFHNNAVSTIEEAVGFYFSSTFRASPSSFFIFQDLSVEQQGEIAAFLRVVNSLANVNQVRKRLEYVKKVRSPGNDALLTIALADTRDARVVLAAQELSPTAIAHISKAESIIAKARDATDKTRPAAMKKALSWLDEAAAALFTARPIDPGPIGGFGGDDGKAGEPGVGGAAGDSGVGGTDPAGMGGSFSVAGRPAGEPPLPSGGSGGSGSGM